MRTEHDPMRALDSLASISLQLAHDLDLTNILTAIVERAMELTEARYGAVVTLSFAGKIEEFLHRGLTPEQVSALPHLPRGEGLLGEVLEQRRAIRIERIGDHPKSVGFPDAHVPMAAFLGVPLEHGDRLVGAIYLTKPPDAQPFSQHDEDFVTVMASMAAVGIENSRLLSAESERAERGSLLRAIASRVRRSLETSDVLSATVQALGRAANVERCFIRLMEDRSQSRTLGPIEYEWDAPDVRPLKEEPEIQFPVTTLAAETRSTQWSEDVEKDERLRDPAVPGNPDDLTALGTRAVLATPLEWGDELLGVVTLHSALPRIWSQSDIALIEAAAREVAVAISHARRYQDALDAAERLRELDQLRSDFVSMVSHELRSPMTVVAGISDILENRHDRLSDKQRKELVETLGRESRRLRRLVSEVLDLEAMDQGHLELARTPVDLLGIVDEAVADAGETDRTSVVADIKVATVHADADRIKQVLLNLISNAAKFSPPGAPIVVSVTTESEFYKVSVSDQGPGIPEDQKAKLFQRFARLQTETTMPGSGLGLYLSKQIIEQHGGQIWAEPGAGPGATFSFRIPR